MIRLLSKVNSTSIIKTSQQKSDNDRAEFIEIQLKRYIIALQILESHNLIEEFRRAIKGGANLPTAEAIKGVVVANQEK